MTPDDLETVRRSIPFANLPETLQDRLLEQAQLQILRPDDVAFVQDELPDALYIVLEGWMKLCRTGSSGPETVISIVSSGRSLGEASVLQGVPYLVTTKAITRARLLRLKAAALREMMKKEPAVAASMLNAALDQLQQLVLQIEDLKARSGVQRLALFLLGRLEDSKDQGEVALQQGAARWPTRHGARDPFPCLCTAARPRCARRGDRSSCRGLRPPAQVDGRRAASLTNFLSAICGGVGARMSSATGSKGSGLIAKCPSVQQERISYGSGICKAAC